MQKSKTKKTSKKKSPQIKSSIFFWIIIFLGISILALSVIEFVDFDGLKKSNEQVVIEIKDECSYMTGIGLVHQIRDEADCSINCVNRCVMEKTKRDKIEFVEMQNDCNTCKCYCK